MAESAWSRVLLFIGLGLPLGVAGWRFVSDLIIKYKEGKEQ